ncbi:hypothetical protein CEXT_416681, partial [Caerostris extrusa]
EPRYWPLSGCWLDKASHRKGHVRGGFQCKDGTSAEIPRQSSPKRRTSSLMTISADARNRLSDSNLDGSSLIEDGMANLGYLIHASY